MTVECFFLFEVLHLLLRESQHCMLSSLTKNKGVNAALSFGNISNSHTSLSPHCANNKALKQPRRPDSDTRLWNSYFHILIY